MRYSTEQNAIEAASRRMNGLPLSFVANAHKAGTGDQFYWSIDCGPVSITPEDVDELVTCRVVIVDRLGDSDAITVRRRGVNPLAAFSAAKEAAQETSDFIVECLRKAEQGLRSVQSEN